MVHRQIFLMVLVFLFAGGLVAPIYAEPVFDVEVSGFGFEEEFNGDVEAIVDVALQYIFENFDVENDTIRFDVQGTINLPGGALSTATATSTSSGNFEDPDEWPHGEPRERTIYPDLLQSHLVGRGYNGGEIRVNWRQDWCYNADGTCEDDQWNLLATLVHEIIHLMGFNSYANIEDGVGHIYVGDRPHIYEVFFGDEDGDLPENWSEDMADFLRGQWGGGVFWHGEARDDDELIELFTSQNFNPSVSIRHTTVGLMSPNAQRGEELDLEVGLEPRLVGMLIDMGWTSAPQDPFLRFSDFPETFETQETREFSLSVRAETNLEEDVQYSVEVPDAFIEGEWEFSEETGIFSGSTTYEDEGEYEISFTATCGELEVSDNCLFMVTRRNRAPVLARIGNRQIDENRRLSFTVEAEDIDGDSLIITMANAPEGARLVVVDNGLSTFTWTPGFDLANQEEDEVGFEIHFQVSDSPNEENDGNALIDPETITVTVNNVNRPPVWEEIQDPTVQEYQPLRLILSEYASDPDRDELDFWYQGELPHGCAIHEDTLVWLPNYDQEGQYQIRLRVEDGMDSDFQNVTVTVLNTNRAPEIEDVENQEISEIDTLEITLNAQDPDENGFFFSALNLPQGAELTEEGTFSWIPTHEQNGEYEVTFLVIDDDEVDPLADSTVVIITVDNVNRNPEKVREIADIQVDEDHGVVIIADLDTVFTEYDEEDSLTFVVYGAERLQLTINEDHILQSLPRDNFYLEPGTEVTIIATDSYEATATEAFVFTINSVNDAPGEFDLDGPSNGDEVRINREEEFSWEEAENVDEDTIAYSLYIEISYQDEDLEITVDTTVVWEEIEGTEYSVQLGEMLESLGIYTLSDDNRKVQTVWWIIATDGELETESSERRTLVLPVPLDVDEVTSDIPCEYSLDQNYPNPFNAVTTIKYSLPQRSTVVIRVYNMMGRLVSQLVSEEQNAGYHTINWDGASVSSGMYILMMKSEGFSSTRKMILTK